MAEGDFLLITPEGWTEAPNFGPILQQYMAASQMAEMVNGMDWNAVSQFLETSGIIGEGATVIDARIMNVGAGEYDLRFWYIPA